MRILIVDDEPLILNGEEALIRQCAPAAQIESFCDPAEALHALQKQPADVVFLDIELPETNGITLAKQMKALCPLLNIVFVTAYDDYYAEAIGLRASGYLQKPVTKQQIEEELCNLRHPVAERRNGMFVRTFGSFEVFFNGTPLHFHYNKTKELFAYLIDRRGTLVSRDELITVLWGGEERHDSYFKQLLKDLRDKLEQIGCGDLLLTNHGTVGLLCDKIACDYFDWIHGFPRGINAYRGEYMRQFSWSEETRIMLEGGQTIWED